MLRKYWKIGVLLALLTVIAQFGAWHFIFSDNVRDNSLKDYHEVFIPTGSDFKDVVFILKKQHVLKNIATFKTLSEEMHYTGQVKPGRYLIYNNQSNLFLIRKLRSGDQNAVRLVLNNITLVEDLAEKASSKLEFSKKDLLRALESDTILKKYNLNKDDVLTLFISNTYEFWWNTSSTKFIERMGKENNKFWNDSRKAKAQKLNLSPTQVVILASIIQKESNKKDEYPRIAGVYLNRLKDNWPLQADPTVKFALKRFDLKRILRVHTRVDSPYNTYKNTGLPPGPICLPETFAIDGVLNAEHHGYYYFCAREDFSGYHNFAATLEEHNLNAHKYQDALNQRNIK